MVNVVVAILVVLGSILILAPVNGQDSSWNKDCGRIIRNKDGTGSLRSANYGSEYKSSLECRWNIDGVEGKEIQLHFQRPFWIESSNDGNCRYDYVEVAELLPSGSVANAQRYCGSQPPQDISILSNGVVIRFHSDNGKGGAGFSLNWDLIHICGGTFNGNPSTGFITSPNYPNNYDNGLTCRWTFNLQDEHAVRFTFTPPFNLERCCDFIRINETLASGEREQTFSWSNGTVVPPNYTSRQDTTKVELLFTSDRSGNRRGFNLTWDIFTNDCGYLSLGNDDTGNLSSVHYGTDYKSNLDCEWVIDGEADHVIHLYFKTLFDIESSNDGKCSYDFLQVLDSLPSGGLVSRGKFCGNKSPPTLISSSNRMVIRFHSDSSKFGAGFALSWDTSCGDVYRGLQGNVTSPNYPDPYPHNFDCRWQIQAPDGYLIKLRFIDPFSIEGYAKCETDYLEIFDYTTASSLISRGKYCGTDLPNEQISMTSRMLLVFHSDSGKSYTGFRAEWDSALAASICGDVFNSSSGSFTSPSFPNTYPDNLNCRWEINVLKGQRIKLVFGSIFDLERDNDGNCFDEVEVIDVLSNGTMVSEGRWCSMPKSQAFYSTASRILVTFNTDVDKGGRGFTASWITVSDCGGVFTTENGYLDSPNFPLIYPKNKLCRWEIAPPVGKNITLRFDKLFDVEISNGCSWDYVQIRLDGSTIGRWCGNSEPPVVEIVGGQKLEVTFRSDKSNVGKGFYASWTSDHLD